MPSDNATHETIGSDILAVLATMKFPEAVLGQAWVDRLQAVEPDGWYPIGMLLELQHEVVRRGGKAPLVQMGRQLFRDSHRQRLTPVLRSARDVLYGIDAMYHHANRGEGIGGWEVLAFAPGRAVLRKTTPHHCALEEGILLEAIHTVGAEALINHRACMQDGAPGCEMEVWSQVRDARWLGEEMTASP